MTPSRPRVKICCVASVDEARLAIDHGASALGLVSAMPSGPGVIDEARIAAIAAVVPPGVATFLLTSQTDAAAIAAQQRRTRVGTIQLCDRVEPGARRALHAALPGIKLVQVVHVTGAASVEEALGTKDADALLLDSGNPDAATRELGGTGRRHDWTLSRSIRERSPLPVYLAGGLTPANAAEAVAIVAPFGLDLCTGVRTDGRLDGAKLAAFFRAIA